MFHVLLSISKPNINIQKRKENIKKLKKVGKIKKKYKSKKNTLERPGNFQILV